MSFIQGQATPGSIVLVISSMDCGGAQRVASMLVNHWAAQKTSVTIVTMAAPEASSFFFLAPSVKVINLNISKYSKRLLQRATGNIKRIAALHNELKKLRPDIVVSFMDTTNVLTILASRGLNIPVIISERSNPGLNPMGSFWETLKVWSYPKAQAVTVLTKAARTYFKPNLQSKIHVIPNPVKPPKLPVIPKDTCPTILAVGRLSEEKRFDLLLRAFASIHTDFPGWCLKILGEGNQREALKSLATDLGVSDGFSMPGAIPDPTPDYASAQIFVLTSRYEGFPNAMLEAMACGLPVLSFDCPNGPKEILSIVPGGILVPNGDVNALANSLRKLITDPDQRQSFGETAKAVSQAYSEEAIMAKWDNLLHQVSQQ